MKDVVERYRQRRQNRLDEKNDVEVAVDKVQAYRDRRDARVKAKVDGGPGSGKPPGYGGAKAAGTFQKKSKTKAPTIQSGFATQEMGDIKSSIKQKGYKILKHQEKPQRDFVNFETGDRETAKTEFENLKNDFESKGYTLKQVDDGYYPTFRAFKNEKDASNYKEGLSEENVESLEVVNYGTDISVYHNYEGKWVEGPAKADITERKRAEFNEKYAGKTNDELEQAYEALYQKGYKKQRNYHRNGGNVTRLNSEIEKINNELSFIDEKLGKIKKQFVRS